MLLTGHEHPSIAAKGRELGARDVVSKALKRDALVARLGHVLARPEARPARPRRLSTRRSSVDARERLLEHDGAGRRVAPASSSLSRS